MWYVRIVRFTLFVLACVDTHRHLTAARVELIVQSLREADIALPPITKDTVKDEQAFKFRHEEPPSEHGNGFYRELPDNLKFLAEMPRRPHSR